MSKKNISNADICRILVDRLEINLSQFRDECLKIDSEDVPETLRTAIREFGIDVIHFINQYQMSCAKFICFLVARLDASEDDVVVLVFASETC